MDKEHFLQCQFLYEILSISWFNFSHQILSVFLDFSPSASSWSSLLRISQAFHYYILVWKSETHANFGGSNCTFKLTRHRTITTYLWVIFSLCKTWGSDWPNYYTYNHISNSVSWFTNFHTRVWELMSSRLSPDLFISYRNNHWHLIHGLNSGTHLIAEGDAIPDSGPWACTWVFWAIS